MEDVLNALKDTMFQEDNANLFQYCVNPTTKSQVIAHPVFLATSFKITSAYSQLCMTPTVSDTRVLIVVIAEMAFILRVTCANKSMLNAFGSIMTQKNVRNVWEG